MIIVFMTHDMHYRPYEKDMLRKYFGELKTIKFPKKFYYSQAIDYYLKFKPDYVLWKLDCEKTRTSEWEEACRLSEYIKNPQINNPAAWLNCNLKEKCFEAWKDAGIDIPEYEVMEGTINPPWYPCIIKVNNNCGGMNTIFMNDEKDRDGLKKFVDECAERKKKYTNTKMLCVKYVDFRTGELYAPVYRAIVAGGKLIGGMVRLYDNNPSQCFRAVLCTNDKIKDSIGMDKTRTECLVKYYKRLNMLFTMHSDYFVKAAKATGLDSVAMDFLDADGKFYMLEAQSDYEIRLQDNKPKAKPFKKWYKRNKERFKKEIPLYIQWMKKEKLLDSIYRSIFDDIGNKRKAH